MAAPSDPSPTRAPRTLAVVLPISLVLLFAAPALPAATIRVSANGQLSLPQAIARAKDGDTITLAKSLSRSPGPLRISNRKDLTLTGESGAWLVCDDVDENVIEILDCAGIAIGVDLTDCDEAEISGCWIHDNSDAAFAFTEVAAISISGCTIEGNAALMYRSSIGDLLMEGNTVSDTSGTTEDSRE